jgi:hypothetical protein
VFFIFKLFPGMFPYVGLATMLLFCHHDWPRKLIHKLKGVNVYKEINSNNYVYNNSSKCGEFLAKKFLNNL